MISIDVYYNVLQIEKEVVKEVKQQTKETPKHEVKSDVFHSFDFRKTFEALGMMLSLLVLLVYTMEACNKVSYQGIHIKDLS